MENEKEKDIGVWGSNGKVVGGREKKREPTNIDEALEELEWASAKI